MSNELDPQELADLLDALIPAGHRNIPADIDDPMAQVAVEITKDKQPQLSADARARILKQVQQTYKTTQTHAPAQAKNGRIIRFPAQAILRWVAVLLVAVVLLNTVAIPAMADSLPGNLLYPVKRAIESVELQLATNDQQLTDVYLTQAERRITETERLLDQNTVNTDLITDALSNVATVNSGIGLDEDSLYTDRKQAIIDHLEGIIARIDNTVSADQLTEELKTIQPAQVETANNAILDVPTATFTAEPSATDTDEPTETATLTPSATFTATVIHAESLAPEITEIVEPSATDTDEPTETATLTPSATPTPTETPTLTPTFESYVGVISATAKVNVRTEPSTDSKIIRTVIPGTLVTIIGESDDGEWIHVDIKGEIQGWVAGYLVVEGVVPLLTAATPTSDVSSALSIDQVSNSSLDANAAQDNTNQNDNTNQGNAGLNKFGCDGLGNSCNAQEQDNSSNSDKKSNSKNKK